MRGYNKLDGSLVDRTPRDDAPGQFDKFRFWNVQLRKRADSGRIAARLFCNFSHSRSPFWKTEKTKRASSNGCDRSAEKAAAIEAKYPPRSPSQISSRRQGQHAPLRTGEHAHDRSQVGAIPSSPAIQTPQRYRDWLYLGAGP